MDSPGQPDELEKNVAAYYPETGHLIDLKVSAADNQTGGFTLIKVNRSKLR
jgi:hypothetical protein